MGKLAVIIDDDSDDIWLLQEILLEVDTSLDCIAFESPLVAIDTLFKKSHPIPHYIFLDYNMPLMNGLECLNALKTTSKFAHSLFVMNSTSINLQVKMKFLSEGGHFIFQKPNSATAYTEIIRQILKQFG